MDWRSTWLYFNHNQKPSYNLTNFKLNQLKSFKIKILLNELTTYLLYYTIYSKSFIVINASIAAYLTSHHTGVLVLILLYYTKYFYQQSQATFTQLNLT